MLSLPLRAVSFGDKPPARGCFWRETVRLFFLPAGGLQEIGTALARDALGFPPSPLLDPLVIAGEQDIWDARSLPFSRAGEMRVLQQPGLEAFLVERCSFADDSRQQTNARVDQHHGRKLAARQHVVADRNLAQAAC